jgi:hypothetical protein
MINEKAKKLSEERFSKESVPKKNYDPYQEIPNKNKELEKYFKPPLEVRIFLSNVCKNEVEALERCKQKKKKEKCQHEYLETLRCASAFLCKDEVDVAIEACERWGKDSEVCSRAVLLIDLCHMENKIPLIAGGVNQITHTPEEIKKYGFFYKKTS